MHIYSKNQSIVNIIPNKLLYPPNSEYNYIIRLKYNKENKIYKKG